MATSPSLPFPGWDKVQILSTVFQSFVPSETSIVHQSFYVAVLTFLVCSIICTWCPVEWSMLKRSYLIAIVHSLVSFYLACYILFTQHYTEIFPWVPNALTPTDSIWFSYDILHAVPVAIAGGYLSFDLFLGVYVDPKMLDTVMKTHHIIGIIASIMSVGFGYGLPLHALMLINEGSNPFTNAHFLFSFQGTMRTLNGFMMWLSYVVCRISYGFLMARLFFYAYLSTDSRLSSATDHMIMYIVQFSLGIVLNCFNLLWFYKITRGLVKSIKQILGYEKISKFVSEDEIVAARAEGQSVSEKDIITSSSTSTEMDNVDKVITPPSSSPSSGNRTRTSSNKRNKSN